MTLLGFFLCSSFTKKSKVVYLVLFWVFISWIQFWVSKQILSATRFPAQLLLKKRFGNWFGAEIWTKNVTQIRARFFCLLSENELGNISENPGWWQLQSTQINLKDPPSRRMNILRLREVMLSVCKLAVVYRNPSESFLWCHRNLHCAREGTIESHDETSGYNVLAKVTRERDPAALLMEMESWTVSKSRFPNAWEEAITMGI